MASTTISPANSNNSSFEDDIREAIRLSMEETNLNQYTDADIAKAMKISLEEQIKLEEFEETNLKEVLKISEEMDVQKKIEDKLFEDAIQDSLLTGKIQDTTIISKPNLVAQAELEKEKIRSARLKVFQNQK
jgi:hypothetical protein